MKSLFIYGLVMINAFNNFLLFKSYNVVSVSCNARVLSYPHTLYTSFLFILLLLCTCPCTVHFHIFRSYACSKAWYITSRNIFEHVVQSGDIMCLALLCFLFLHMLTYLSKQDVGFANSMLAVLWLEECIFL